MSDYAKTTFVEGAAPGISAAEMNKLGDGVATAHSELQSHIDAADPHPQYATDTDLTAHKTAATLDHPDGSVIDAKIGSRTPDQTLAPASPGTGTLTQILSWLANRIKAITGATNWWDAPAATIAAIWAKFNATTGHKHTGGADDAPILPAASITQGPSSGLNADLLDGLHASAFVSKLSGGTKIQSGYVSGSATVTFPTAFATLVAIVCVAKNGVGVSISVYNESATGFTYAYSSSPTGLYWIAIGT